ncbi:hypothetical protein MSAS_24600 [Mycobacterium saskatchewanense]|nr:hypothetical protein MSAS_24600 [Mycobacterium saskatchewanense]
MHRADRADHAGGLPIVTALYDGVKPVLRRQQLFGGRGVEADAGNPPTIRNSGACKVIEVNGLMCAVEIARADVNDTTLEGRPLVGGYGDSPGVQSKGGIAEGDATFWTPGQYAHPSSLPGLSARLTPSWLTSQKFTFET